MRSGPLPSSGAEAAQPKHPASLGGPPKLRGGFTTLSSSLGQAVVATHAGLLQAVRSEAASSVLQVLLRALCVLVAGSPYDRLPTGLLPQAMEVREDLSVMRLGGSEAGPFPPSGREDVLAAAAGGRGRVRLSFPGAPIRRPSAPAI